MANLIFMAIGGLYLMATTAMFLGLIKAEWQTSIERKKEYQRRFKK